MKHENGQAMRQRDRIPYRHTHIAEPWNRLEWSAMRHTLAPPVTQETVQSHRAVAQSDQICAALA